MSVMFLYFGFGISSSFIVVLYCESCIWTVGNTGWHESKGEVTNSGLVSLFPSSLFLLLLVRQRSSLRTLSLQVLLLHRPSRDWRTRTDFSHRLNSLPGNHFIRALVGQAKISHFFFFFCFYVCWFQEVTEKSERIAQLEQEKSALIKQLFEARARSAQDTSTLDSTFIWEEVHSTTTALWSS